MSTTAQTRNVVPFRILLTDWNTVDPNADELAAAVSGSISEALEQDLGAVAIETGKLCKRFGVPAKRRIGDDDALIVSGFARADYNPVGAVNLLVSSVLEQCKARRADIICGSSGWTVTKN